MSERSADLSTILGTSVSPPWNGVYFENIVLTSVVFIHVSKLNLALSFVGAHNTQLQGLKFSFKVILRDFVGFGCLKRVDTRFSK